MIRRARDGDWPQIWTILKPIFRAGETYAVPRDISEDAARAMWMVAPNATFVYEDASKATDPGGTVIGTYYIKTNHGGAASHICNCGYMTAEVAQGRGVATALCLHSLDAASALGYSAMQFNMVLASNAGAVRLWEKLGFDIVGTLPRAFDHPKLGFVDAHVMWKAL